MKKHKRLLLIAFAVLFIASLFLLKNKSVFKNEISEAGGLTYDNEIIADLVNRDADGDSVPDWEEGLWGTDPTKKDTNDDGTPDNVEIDRMKSTTATSEEVAWEEENLSQTDRFSRELFTTIATLNQAGQIDEATIEKLSSSLAGQIQDHTPRKIFLASEIKIKNDNSAAAIDNYITTVDSLYQKNPVNGNPIEILQKFMNDGENVDMEILAELDPIIENTRKMIIGMAKMEVPSGLAKLHLDFINTTQRLVENLEDLKLFEDDVVVALGAISQYEINTEALSLITSELENIIIRQSIN